MYCNVQQYDLFLKMRKLVTHGITRDLEQTEYLILNLGIMNNSCLALIIE